MRILITGSRHEHDPKIVWDAINEEFTGLYSEAVIVHGACPHGGVDESAARWAHYVCATEEPHPADWERFGKAAGPKRNQAMVDLGADICLAFPGPSSRGTWDCVKRARRAGIPTRIVEVAR